MVASIEETANRLGISKTFIGLILLPVVVNTFTLPLELHLTQSAVKCI